MESDPFRVVLGERFRLGPDAAAHPSSAQVVHQPGPSQRTNLLDVQLQILTGGGRRLRDPA